MLKIIPQRLVIQSWRSIKFNDGHPDSTLILAFTPEGTTGRMDLVHLDVPAHNYQGVIEGWETQGQRERSAAAAGVSSRTCPPTDGSNGGRPARHHRTRSRVLSSRKRSSAERGGTSKPSASSASFSISSRTDRRRSPAATTGRLGQRRCRVVCARAMPLSQFAWPLKVAGRVFLSN